MEHERTIMNQNVRAKVEQAFDCLYEVLSEVNTPPPIPPPPPKLAVVLGFPKTSSKLPLYKSRQCFHLPVFKPEDEVD